MRMSNTRDATEAVRLAIANQTILRSSPFPMQDMSSAIQQIEDAVDRLLLLPTASSASVPPVNSGVTISVDSNMFDERPFILAEDVIAPVNIPFSNCSRLDGYAVVSDDGVGQFTVVVSRRAGDGGILSPLNRGEVAYVTTGAPLPIGADAICKIEDTSLVYDSSGNYISSKVNIKVATKPGEGVRKPGSDVREGEVLLPAGHVLTPVDIGSLLLAKVRTVVRKRVSSAALLFPTDDNVSPILSLDDGCVGVLSTGDEIVDITHVQNQNNDIDQLKERKDENEDEEVENDDVLNHFGSLHEDDDNIATLRAHIIRDILKKSRVQGDVNVNVNVNNKRPSNDHSNTVSAHQNSNNTKSVNKMNDDFVWDSNKPMLSAMVRSHGFTPIDCGIVKDEGGVNGMCEAILSAASTCRLLIITGGVSMGDKDHVKPALVKLGAEILFGRLMMKPGKPCTAAILPRLGKQPLMIFALPGNPVSAAVCFNVLVVPVLRRMSGLPWPLSRLTQVKVCLVGESIQLDPERPEYHRATVWWANEIDGGKNFPSGVALCGRSTGAQASSRMQSVSNANALLCLPASSDVLKPGSIVDALLIGTVYNRQAVPLSISTPTLARSVVIQSSSCGGHHHHHNHNNTHSSTPTSTPLPPPLPTTTSTPNSCLQNHEESSHQSSGRQPHIIESINNDSAPRRSVTVSIITVSDSAFHNGAVDKSGPEILSMLTRTYPQWEINVVCPPTQTATWENRVIEKNVSTSPQSSTSSSSSTTTTTTTSVTRTSTESTNSRITIVPDDYSAIKDALLDCVSLDSHLIITTGGTGFGSRDITPEATEAVLDRKAPGLVFAMLSASMKHTPMAALSRYTAGTRDKSLIINLPGSPKAVKECLEAITSVLPHALSLIRN